MGEMESGRSVRRTVEATEVTVTGTGIPGLDPKRAGAGVLVRHGDVTLQFDAGRATAMRMIEAGADVADLDAIFITHYHSDHVIGLHDFVINRWVEDDHDEADRLDIVAPLGPTSRYCERLLDLWVDDLEARAAHNHRSADHNVNLLPFEVPDAPIELWRKGDVRVLAGPVRHEPVEGAVGYRIETPDGVVVISGDTRVCPEMATLAAGADVVVYEATRTDAVLALNPALHFIADYHADTVEIGRQMAALDVPTLLLTHLIPAPQTDDEKASFVDDVRRGGYTGELLVCDDLDTIILNRAARTRAVLARPEPL